MDQYLTKLKNGRETPSLDKALEGSVESGRETPSLDKALDGSVESGRETPSLDKALEGLVESGRETPSPDKALEGSVESGRFASAAFSTEFLLAMKDFVEDLSSVVHTSNFEMYKSIVNRIDESKVNAYSKMIRGVKQFFLENETQLKSGSFENLPNPYLSYVSENGTFSFNIETALRSITEDEQEVVKDHLNHIWSLINCEEKSVEEVYIDNVFKNVDAKFSPNMSKDQQIEIAKDLFTDFQKQDMDINVVVKYACKKARRLLEKNGCEETSSTMILIDEVEKIDINSFNMIQLLGIVGKVGTMFSQGDENPMKYLLPGIFTTGQEGNQSANSLIPEIDGLKLVTTSDKISLENVTPSVSPSVNETE